MPRIPHSIAPHKYNMFLHFFSLHVLKPRLELGTKDIGKRRCGPCSQGSHSLVKKSLQFESLSSFCPFRVQAWTLLPIQREIYYKDIRGLEHGPEGRLAKKKTPHRKAASPRSSCCCQQHHTPQLEFNPNILLSLSHSLKRQKSWPGATVDWSTSGHMDQSWLPGKEEEQFVPKDIPLNWESGES